MTRTELIAKLRFIAEHRGYVGVKEAADMLEADGKAARLALDALHRVDAIERGMVTTKAHHYAARQETTDAIAALKEVL